MTTRINTNTTQALNTQSELWEKLDDSQAALMSGGYLLDGSGHSGKDGDYVISGGGIFAVKTVAKGFFWLKKEKI